MVAALIAPYTLEASTAQAASGDLDLTFDDDGKVTTDFAGLVDEAGGVAIQPDGKIIVAGGSGTDFGLARYNSDGSLDPGFGTGGTVTTDFAAGTDGARAVAIQPDGKIVATGAAFVAGNDNFAVARYHPNGSLDNTFGEAGKVVTDFAGFEDEANSVALQPDGKIVAAGRVFVVGTVDFGLTRYKSDGSLDPTFGGGGKVRTDIAGVFNQASGVVIQHDGGIVAAGQASVGSSDFAVTRYRSNGSLDPGFGIGGKVTTDFGSFDQARGVAIQHDGNIVAAGLTFMPGVDFAVARYRPNGSADPGFDADGKVTTDFAGGDDEALGVRIQHDGKIVTAGVATVAGQLDFGVTRYNGNGSTDLGFGGDGKVTTNFAGDFDAANAVAIQPDGKIVAAGRAVVAGSSDVAVARYGSTTSCTIIGPPPAPPAG